MNAPKKLKFQNVDTWKSSNFFPAILSYTKGLILDTDLPKEVILVDRLSLNEYKAELLELVPFKFSIPSIFSRMCKNMNPEELRLELKKFYPDKDVEDFAFYLYQFKS